MTPIVVSDILAVGEVPSLEQFEILAKAGFKSVINNQPDGEVERFAGSKEIAAAAEKAGLAQAYLPVASRTPSTAELDAFANTLKTLPAPIYAFCYSGVRSATACAFVMTGTRTVDDVIADFGEAGFDVSALRPWLEDESKRRGGPKPASATAAAPAAAASATAPAAVPSTARPANGNGGGASASNGNGGGHGLAAAASASPVTVTPPKPQAPAASPAATTAKEALQGIVVMPRAAGFGGYAM